MSEQKMKKPGSGSEEQMSLDDGRRVKVLSPGMMVFKRFIRNRLAIVGICILIFMFAFSFIGGVVSPYRQDQVFYKTDYANKEYASAVVNNEFRFTTAPGETLSAMARATFNSEVKKSDGDTVDFVAEGKGYSAKKLDDDFYLITSGSDLASITLLGKITDVKSLDGSELDADVKDAAVKAVGENKSSFEVNGEEYTLTKGMAKSYTVGYKKETGIASKLSFDAHSNEYSALIAGFEFRKAAELAMHAGETAFEADDVTYKLDADGENSAVIYSEDGKNAIASVSNVIVSPVNSDVFLPIEYKDAAAEAIANKQTVFEYVTEDGTTQSHNITLRSNSYIISTMQETLLIDMYAQPSLKHPLGTDDHGMDVLTRLMYGGRISLLVGFVVMILENIIGIVVGGISGYFGGWVDTFLMRFVDLFNSIPYYPMMIIAGAVMDSFEVDPYKRIFLLMAIMGIMGWTGVARVVRGQILSLREQDFMVATEATGIKVSRRIFRHLIPNVMPLLIVQATMGLGGIILTEATLSFLGLGIKYPLASWGSIINAASNIYVMTNFWFIWIPAGFLIVLTVLGFNFVGDGLRDAFDPKMKR